MPTYAIYSINGRLMHETDDEEVARRGLAIWPKAWTLTCDGKAVDLNVKPSGVEEMPLDEIRHFNQEMQAAFVKKLNIPGIRSS